MMRSASLVVEERAFYKTKIAVAHACCNLDVSTYQLPLMRPLLHPVRRAPLEILGLIFKYCVDAAFFGTRFIISFLLACAACGTALPLYI